MIDVLLPGSLSREAEKFGLEVVPEGKRLVIDASRKSSVSKLGEREKVDLVIVRASSRPPLMRFLKDRRVDVVFPDPAKVKLDASLLNLAKKNSIAVGLSLDSLRSEKALRSVAKSAGLIEKKAMLVLSTGAERREELRDLRSVASLLHLLGFSFPYLLRSLKTPELLVARNRERGIGPGVSLEVEP